MGIVVEASDVVWRSPPASELLVWILGAQNTGKPVGLAVAPRGAAVDVPIFDIYDKCGKDAHLLDHIKPLIWLHSLDY